jgi:hypothetical protein
MSIVQVHPNVPHRLKIEANSNLYITPTHLNLLGQNCDDLHGHKAHNTSEHGV